MRSVCGEGFGWGWGRTTYTRARCVFLHAKGGDVDLVSDDTDETLTLNEAVRNSPDVNADTTPRPGGPPEPIEHSPQLWNEIRVH